MTLSDVQIEEQFLNTDKFSKLIEELVLKRKVNHFEAVLIYCEENDVDVDDIKKYCKGVLKEKMEYGAIQDGLLPKKTTLDFN